VALLASPRDEPWLGPAYPYLQGQALRRLGLSQEMVRLHDRAVRTARGGDEPAVRRGVPRRRPDEGGAGALAKAKSRSGTRAKLRLAEIDLREGKARECVRRCRALRASREADDRAVLPLLGRGYAALGDFTKASQCFSGKVPGDGP
jgi:hypothetical protein